MAGARDRERHGGWAHAGSSEVGDGGAGPAGGRDGRYGMDSRVQRIGRGRPGEEAAARAGAREAVDALLTFLIGVEMTRAEHVSIVK